MSTTEPNPVEVTGEIVMHVGPDGLRWDAPARAVIPEHELFGFERVVVDGQLGIQLPDGIRYRIGVRHRRWPGARILHRLP